MVIEHVSSYGMRVGQTTFDTCVWIGRFMECALRGGLYVKLMYRKDVKKQLNSTLPKGEKVTNDASIVNYLHQRFAPNTPNRGKGTKGSKGFFYGFKSDIWQSYALSVAYIDKNK